MTDIHTHILPGIDDGAQDIDTAIDLLQQEYSSGVTKIVLTPHFHPAKQELEEFLKKRRNAMDVLQKEMKEEELSIQCKLGMEIYYSTSLFHLEPKKLAIEGTPYILVEFSTARPPIMVEKLFSMWSEQGFIPIIAHVERYSYVRENIELLKQWEALGALAQVNASSIIRRGKHAKFIKKAMEQQLIHFVASDTHDPEWGPANMTEGLKLSNTFFAPRRSLTFIKNADKLFDTI